MKSQLKKIREIPQIKEDDLSELINFSTKMRNLVSFLHNAEADPYLHNPSLIEELLNKLPLQRRLQWAEHVMNAHEFPSIAGFSHWISHVAKVASLVETTTTLSVVPTTSKQSKKRSMHTTEVKSNLSCLSCQGNHYINQCSKFKEMPVNQRWEWVKKISVYFCCLKKGHRITDCRYRKQCGAGECKLKHHSLLHEDRKPNVEQPQIPKEPVPVANKETKCHQFI